MKTKSREYYHFTMTAYRAYLVGDEHLLQQHITKTECRYKRIYCTPQEMPYSKLVWLATRLDFRLYHPIGNYKIHELKNYLLIPALSIGGGINPK